jgi:chemotaxis signal transduction protein
MSDAQAAAAPRSDFCIFVRDGQRFALSTAIAKEVLEARPFTPVPGAPPELLGAFNLRGEVIPLVNLDRVLDVAERPAGRDDTLLLLCHGDLTVAAVVDHVVIIKHVSPWEVRRAKLDPSIRNPLVRGLVGRDAEQTMVLDGERMLTGLAAQIAAGLRGTMRSAGMPVPIASSGGDVAVAAASRLATAEPRTMPEVGASEGAEADDADPSASADDTPLAGGR